MEVSRAFKSLAQQNLPKVMHNPGAAEYYASLCDPWNNTAKVPLGFQVKSCAMHYIYRVPIILNASSVLIGNNAYTLTTPGTDVVFWFNPNQFDAAPLLQASFTSAVSGSTIFYNWFNQVVPKGYSANFSSWRLVSAGIRYYNYSAPLYTQGLLISSASNARSAADYGTGGTGYAAFIADPDNKLSPLHTGLVESITYTPTDLGDLDFISTSAVQADNQDWAACIVFNGWNSSSGISGYIEVAVNYEGIPFGPSEMLVNPTVTPGGTTQDAEAVIASKKATDRGYNDMRPGVIPLPYPVSRTTGNGMYSDESTASQILGILDQFKNKYDYKKWNI